MVLTACGLDARIWETRSGRRVCTFREPDAALIGAAFSPDGTRLVTTEAFRHIARVWDTTTGREMATLSDGDALMTCCAFSPNGQQIAIGSADGVARIWNSAPQRFSEAGRVASEASSPRLAISTQPAQ
jgi:WD40 repeat protein